MKKKNAAMHICFKTKITDQKADSVEYVGEFNNTPPKAQPMKEIIEKLDFIKI